MTATAPTRSRRPVYEGSRIPYPIPTVLKTPAEIAATGDVMMVNFGPNHPSTHGVLRLVVDLYGEDVTGLAAVIGYLHTGFEKNMEQKTWWKAIPYAPRMDYVSYQNNEYVFVGAVEKLLALEVPPKATWMRTLLLELNRIHSHLVWLGTSALELGRDLDVLVRVPRARADPRPLRARRRATACTRATSRSAAWRRTSRAASIRRRASSATGCRRRSTTTRRS